MQNSVVVFIQSALDWKDPFWAKLVQKCHFATELSATGNLISR